MSDSHPVPDHFYYNIGLIAAKWSAIEAELEFAILEGFEIEAGSGLILSSQLGYRGKIDLIRVLLNARFDHKPTKDQEMFDLIAEVDKAYTRRNAVVHSVWVGTDDPKIASRVTVRAKGKLAYGYTAVSIEELEADVETLQCLGSALRTAREAKRFNTKDSDKNTTQQ